MITIYLRDNKDKELLQLEEFTPHAFVYVEQPTEEEIQILRDEFSLAPHLLHDALDMDEVPRIEQEDGDIYIFTRFAYGENEEIKTAPMLLVLRKDSLLALSPHVFPKIQGLLGAKSDIITSQENKLLVRLFSEINNTYNDYLNTVSKRIRTLSVRIDKIKNKDIMQFVVYENVLSDFSSSLVRINNSITSLLGGKIIALKPGEVSMLEDVSTDMTQHIQISKENLQSIISIRDAYSTIMTNNLNRVIKLFTS